MAAEVLRELEAAAHIVLVSRLAEFIRRANRSFVAKRRRDPGYERRTAGFADLRGSPILGSKFI